MAALRKCLVALTVSSVGAAALLYWGLLPTRVPLRAAEGMWAWQCEERRCVRRERNSSFTAQSLETCRMLCGTPPLWPRPTGRAVFGDHSAPFCLQRLRFDLDQVPKPRVRALLWRAAGVFRTNLWALMPGRVEDPCEGHLVVTVAVAGFDEEPFLRLDTNESYSLKIGRRGSEVRALVEADSFFGARHGLETLSQLAWWDGRRMRVVSRVAVRDAPKFAHRGVLVDTARNFVSLDALRRTLDALAACRLNTLHWHVSDSQSFPFDSPRVGQMARFGAYSPLQVYSARDVAGLADYARVRGVRLVMEIDAPGHAGAGWEWGPRAGLGNLSVCEGEAQQLNPQNPATYDVLGALYRDVFELTNVTDVFHMGGDEVSLDCWARELPGPPRTRDQLLRLWGRFHLRALRLLPRAPTTVLLWSSDLTGSRHAPDPALFAVQSWGAGSWPEARALLRRGFRLVMSPVDAWYLDCGFGPWKGSGKGSCTHLHSWQDVYRRRPWGALEPSEIALVLGGEACLWGETTDEHALDAKLWPRGAALAERLWSDPQVDEDISDVQLRLAAHRERLVARGVKADAVWPEWCSQNPGFCAD